MFTFDYETRHIKKLQGFTKPFEGQPSIFLWNKDSFLVANDRFALYSIKGTKISLGDIYSKSGFKAACYDSIEKEYYLLSNADICSHSGNEDVGVLLYKFKEDSP